MTVGIVCLDSQASIEQKHTTIGPRSQQTTLVGRWGEIGIVLFDCQVDVLERGWSDSWRADREAEPMSLVGAVVGILTKDNNLHSIKRCMA